MSTAQLGPRKSSTADKTVRLWKQDGTLLRTLKGHSAIIRDVAFSPDGQVVASASEDNTVKLWRQEDHNVNLDPLAYGCNWVHDYLRTNAELKENERHLCDRSVY
ncbi:MAG: hypothetical protein DSM106950_19590 [Stigonema ocellatum SAG 48.90 = DSM 106950]|nr:hypothetical protein [Stigonema ocellatum SAG 48.90 = DSM 106950]